MRKVIAGLLLGLGSFLLVAALTVVLWGGDAVKKTPLDTDSVTNLSGSSGNKKYYTLEVPAGQPSLRGTPWFALFVDGERTVTLCL